MKLINHIKRISNSQVLVGVDLMSDMLPLGLRFEGAVHADKGNIIVIAKPDSQQYSAVYNFVTMLEDHKQGYLVSEKRAAMPDLPTINTDIKTILNPDEDQVNILEISLKCDGNTQVNHFKIAGINYTSINLVNDDFELKLLFKEKLGDADSVFTGLLNKYLKKADTLKLLDFLVYQNLTSLGVLSVSYQDVLTINLYPIHVPITFSNLNQGYLDIKTDTGSINIPLEIIKESKLEKVGLRSFNWTIYLGKKVLKLSLKF